MTTVRPLQRKSYAEKMAKDKDGVSKWGKENIEYYIASSNFNVTRTSEDRDVQMLYNLYNNKLPDKWFNYVRNPINSTKDQYKNFPARIRSYTILRPNIDLIHGEYPKRPFNYQVINAGHDAWYSFLEKKKEILKKNVTQHFINYVNASGIDTGEDTQQVQLPQQLIDEFITSYQDLRAIKGQKALKVIEEENSIRELLNDLFKDWLIAGEAYTFKDIRNSDIDYERVSPLECDYDKSSNSKYIEDGEWFTRRTMSTVSDVIDRFYEDLKEIHADDIEKSTQFVKAPTTIFGRTISQHDNREDKRSKIEVIHTTWKSQMKVGILSYPDPLTGQIQEIEVDETYKPDKSLGESVEWYWVTQVWEGYRIDGRFYVRIRPIPVQRNRMNGLSYCKLPYNGRRFSDTHSTNISPMELGVPYQIMHVILKYRLELTIAKSKGKIALLDKNAIPNKAGWDEEKFLYYAEATGYGFIDRNQIGVDKSWNQYQVLDMDLFNHIQQMIGLIDNNKREWDEVLGINPYRKGQTEASDAVGNVQQGIFQSSIISDMIFVPFEEFVKSEYKGLLDYSKFAWVEGKKKVYRRDDLSTELINIEPDDYLGTDFDIFVTNSTKEAENLAALKANAQAFAQNKAKPSVVAEIIGADNFAEVKRTLMKLEQMEQQLAEKMEASKSEAEKEKLRITQEFEAIKHDFAIDLQSDKYQREQELMNAEYNRKEGLAYIEGDITLLSTDAGGDSNLNGIPDINEVEKRAVEREKISNDKMTKDKELALKNEELKLKNKEIESKERSDKYKANVQLEIAEKNKNKYDSKK